MALLLNDPDAPQTTMPPEVEADHERIEIRTATVSTEIGWLQKQHQWPGLKAIGKLERRQGNGGDNHHRDGFYLLSSALTPELFNGGVRQHWSIENSLHDWMWW